MTKSGLDRMNSGTVCTARRRSGTQCLNYAIRGAAVCRLHGGSAPQVRKAAQVRLLMAADGLAGLLVRMAYDDKLPPAVRLQAIRDGLDRAGLAPKSSVSVDVEISDKRSFEDVTADVVMDLDMGDIHIEDAEVIEDDNTPLVPRNLDDIPPAQTRGDRAFEANIERGRRAEVQRMRSGGMSEEERARREAEAFTRTTTPNDSRGRAAYLAALDAGATHADADRAARAAVEGSDNSGKRRARVSKATITDRRSDR
jgi:hypothetical protein